MAYIHNSSLLFGEDIIANSSRDTVITWCKAMLGEDPSGAANSGVSVELSIVHYDSAIDDALQEYSAIINEWAALDNLAKAFGALGSTTGSPVNVKDVTQRRVLSTFGFILKSTNKYSEIVRAGGNVQEQRAYFATTVNQQHYNLLDRLYEAEVSNVYWTNTYVVDNIITVELPATTNFTLADASNWEIDLKVRRSTSAGKYKTIDLSSYVDYTHFDTNTLTIHLTDTSNTIFDAAVHYAPEPSGGWSIDELVTVTLKAPYSIDLYDEDGVQIFSSDLDRKEIEIHEVNWYPPSTIFHYYDPYNAMANVGADAFGFAYTAETPIYSNPIFYDILRGAQHKISAKVRRNNFSVVENNKRITIFPYPGSDVAQIQPGKVWFDYIVPLNPFDDDEATAEGSISSMANIPYFQLQYSSINNIGQRWVHKWSLASCKEILGRIRGKYTHIPVPNSDMSLDGPSLLDEARGEKEELRQSLRTILEKTLGRTVMEAEANEAESLNTILKLTPSPHTISMG